MFKKLMDALVEVEEADDDTTASPVVVVLCNCSPGESPSLARTLVTEKLAACVNIVRGVTSFYVWEGNFEEAEEHTLLIKTTADSYGAMKKRLAAIHSYSNPEIIALGAIDVAKPYAEWVAQQTRGEA